MEKSHILKGCAHVQYGYVRDLTAEVIGRDMIGFRILPQEWVPVEPQVKTSPLTRSTTTSTRTSLEM